MRFRKLETLVKWVGIIAIVNFIVFLLITLTNGGYAGPGFVRDGHYFLTSRGIEKEVGYSQFLYSGIHFYILLANYAVTVFLAIYLNIQKRVHKNNLKASRLARKQKK